MKINMDSEEFAKLFVLIEDLNEFLHQKRTMSEFIELQHKLYPYVREMYYDILCRKIDVDKIDNIEEDYTSRVNNITRTIERW